MTRRPRTGGVRITRSAATRVILNRNGLHAAAAALAGARTEEGPNLTPEQKRKAARHLIRHYRDLEEEPPESLRKMAGG